jgi:hypothetical protein
MKAAREAVVEYAGTERIIYKLSEPLTDRTYPFIDSLTGALRFGVADLVMTWGQNGEHLNICDMKGQVRDFTPIVIDRDRVLAAINAL